VAEQVRPTKKQRELLSFIEQFIAEHGYSPSYREIRDGVGYTSIATVALHVNNLVARGHLIKRDHAARSLEVVAVAEVPKVRSNEIKPAEEKWLVEQIDYRFRQAEASKALSQADIDGLYVLVGALSVLGLEGAAMSFIARLSELKKSLVPKSE
jgi:SOS-response transcriptional repressor LexA